jgi:hypothetical protein
VPDHLIIAVLTRLLDTCSCCLSMYDQSNVASLAIPAKAELQYTYHHRHGLALGDASVLCCSDVLLELGHAAGTDLHIFRRPSFGFSSTEHIVNSQPEHMVAYGMIILVSSCFKAKVFIKYIYIYSRSSRPLEAILSRALVLAPSTPRLVCSDPRLVRPEPV